MGNRKKKNKKINYCLLNPSLPTGLICKETLRYSIYLEWVEQIITQSICIMEVRRKMVKKDNKIIRRRRHQKEGEVNSSFWIKLIKRKLHLREVAWSSSFQFVRLTNHALLPIYSLIKIALITQQHKGTFLIVGISFLGPLRWVSFGWNTLSYPTLKSNTFI